MEDEEKNTETVNEIVLKIKSLDLDPDTKDIIEAIATNNVTYTDINLDEADIGIECAILIGKSLAKNTTLERLSLKYNDIGNSGAEAIAEGLRKNSSLERLFLDEADIGSEGIVMLGHSLANNGTLKRLTLNGNEVGDSGASSIAEGLCKNSRLQVLSLNEADIGNDGATSIGESLAKNTSLKLLMLNMNSIGDSGTTSIADGLRCNSSLQRIQLSENEIGDAGATSIGLCLADNKSLQQLILMGNNIGDLGAISIAQGIRKNTSLQILAIGGNALEADGFLSLAKACRLNKYIKSIDATVSLSDVTHLITVNKQKEIGSGAFGCVDLVEENGKLMVEKRSTHGGGEILIEESYERLVLHGLPTHKNIVQFMGVSFEGGLLLEAHNGGSLLEYTRNRKAANVGEFLHLSLQMSEAVEHLHKYGLIHRDLAQRNYVLSDDLQTVVLIDFGLAWPLQSDEFISLASEKLPWRQCPPEVFNSFVYYKASDVWQLGLAFWQFLLPLQPFHQFRRPRSLQNYLNLKMLEKGCPVPLVFNKNDASEELISVVQEIVLFCCTYDHTERPTATQVVQKIQSLQQKHSNEVPLIQTEIEQKEEYKPNEAVVEDGLKVYISTDYENFIDHYKDINETDETGEDESLESNDFKPEDYSPV